MVAKGQQPHRVTEHFAGFADASLRAAMERLAASGHATGVLAAELRSYALCKLDDTWAEAVHRDVTGHGKRAPASQIAHMAASQRLHQNIRLADSLQGSALEYFHRAFRCWKAIGQRAPKAASRLRPRKTKANKLKSMVYRYDGAALRNWSAVLGSSKCDRASGWSSVISRMQVEWLSAVVPEGELLSFPAVSDDMADKLRTASTAEAFALLRGRRPADNTFFIVTDVRAHYKKRVRSSSLRARDEGMVMPVLLQRMATWTDASHADSLMVYHDGYPTLTDLLGLTSWHVLRCGLQKWAAGSSAISGCLTVTDGRPLTAVAWDSADAPTLALLDELVGRGWEYGQPPKEHTRDSPKMFTAKDPIAAKAYLRCLLRLEDLLSNGQLAALRSDQQNRYYSCILVSGQPQSVPLGASASDYQKLLLKVEATADGQQADNAPLVDIASDEDGPMVSFSAPTQHRDAKQTSGQRGAKRKRASGDSWQELVVGGLRRRATAAGGVAEGSSTRQQGRPAGSSNDPPIIQEPSASGRRRRGRQRAAKRGGVCTMTEFVVEGVAVQEEAWGLLSCAGSYRRLIVRCPVHQGCKKKRNYDTEDSRSGGLGHLEPFAFLGCWLSQHARFASAE